MKRVTRDAMLLLLAWDCMTEQEQKTALRKGLRFSDIQRAEDLTEAHVDEAIGRLVGGTAKNWRRLAPSSQEQATVSHIDANALKEE